MTTEIKIPRMSFPEHVAALEETCRSLRAAFAEPDSLAALVLAREAVVGFESLLADLKETIEDRHRETVSERWDRLVIEGAPR